MPALRHSWPFEPGRWAAAGRIRAEGQRERQAQGTSLIPHADAVWEIEGVMEIGGEPPVRLRNDVNEHSARADVDRALESLERAGDEPPRQGDEIVSDLRRPRRARRSESPASSRR